jgi:AsmA protein
MKILKIVGIVVAILLLVLIALPFLINVNSFRPKIESELTSALGRQVTLGNLSLSLLSGNVGADNIAIADDPRFSKSPFITAKSLKVGVEMMPLIFSKQLNVTGITLDQPEITLLKTPQGMWNFSSIGAGAKKTPDAAKTSSPSTQNLSVARLNINNGKLSIGKANSSAKPIVYNKVNIEVTNFSFTSQFPFKLTAAAPVSGDINISGKAGPINPDDASKTPIETAVKINNIPVGSTGLLDPSSGISGIASFDGTLNSDGNNAKAVGLFTGNKMQFAPAPKGAPAPKPITIRHTVNIDLDKQLVTITQGDVGIGSAQAHLTGTLSNQNDAQIANLKLEAPGMSVDELESMLPAFGVVIPQGSQLKGGTLSTNLAITGPMNNLVIVGPVKLSNTKLAGFDLGSKMGALSAFAGKAVSNPDTSITNFSLDAKVTQAMTQANNINLTVPAIGVITGAGTVSPSGALNFQMLANLQGGALGGLSAVASGGGKGIPFAIEGTTANPKFVPKLSGMVGGVAQSALGEALGGAGGAKGGAAAGVNALGGLLGGKKKK